MVGSLYAAVSVYWGAGGAALSDTVGGSLAQGGRAGNATVITVLWAAVALKLAAAALPLLALQRPAGHRTHVARRLAWIAAGTLTVYGGVLTGVGLLVQAGVIHRSRNADQRALAWHAYLWDPWFLVWGLLITTALMRSRDVTPPRIGASRPRAS